MSFNNLHSDSANTLGKIFPSNYNLNENTEPTSTSLMRFVKQNLKL
jgi:hypothetical protein